ncbi:hypothetical protein DL95DRAFT_410090 [Leptodontidium sp. 2 PMI_412]|nr:hypothetical protein DL95DRAFT_410090 [Leptodontidium sp. 2 PMI_412]
MNFLTYLPHFREYFTDLPRTSSTTPTKSASTSKSTSTSLSSSLPSIFLTLLLAIPILLPITFISTIAYIEYHRLPCTISWVKRLRTSIALAAGCCCRVCLRMADGTKTTEREEGDMGGNGIGDGEESGEGEKEEQEQEGNGTTARKGWYRDLGQRERYGKLFKNSSGGSEGDEMLLRDMEGSEDGLAVLL